MLRDFSVVDALNKAKDFFPFLKAIELGVDSYHLFYFWIF
jgi:hypothetical protein